MNPPENIFHLTPDAITSLKKIALYTRQTWGEKQCRLYLKSIDVCFHKLTALPTLGKPRPEIYRLLRSHPVGKHIIYYMIQDKHIVIVNVLHNKMDPFQHMMDSKLLLKR